MTLQDFKIYVPTLDEECLIPYTLGALLKVFPSEQIEVIDLGSNDSTVSRVPAGIKVHHVQLSPEAGGQQYTALKKEFSAKQERVFWVDGDEIYPTESLERIKRWVEMGQAGQHDESGLRVYWRILRERDGKIECSNEYLSAGPKVFNSRLLNFHRAWPKEVIVRVDPNAKAISHKSEFNGVWFWHGVLLERSSAKERTARYKKRQTKLTRYDQYLSWEQIPCYPWKDDYKGAVLFPWKVINMSSNDEGYDQSWQGTTL